VLTGPPVRVRELSQMVHPGVAQCEPRRQPLGAPWARRDRAAVPENGGLRPGVQLVSLETPAVSRRLRPPNGCGSAPPHRARARNPTGTVHLPADPAPDDACAVHQPESTRSRGSVVSRTLAAASQLRGLLGSGFGVA
jgi:hypothetical protein